MDGKKEKYNIRTKTINKKLKKKHHCLKHDLENQ